VEWDRFLTRSGVLIPRKTIANEWRKGAQFPFRNDLAYVRGGYFTAKSQKRHRGLPRPHPPSKVSHRLPHEKRANHEFLPLSVNELRPGVGGKFI
jgi:hypothetical protein